jgi:predicted RNA-binding protein Jag
VEEILAPQAAEILKKITSYYGLDVKVEAEETNRAINLRVGGEDIGQLIGRRGRTLGSVQYIISRILNEDRPNKKKILIDVDGYCESRERTLREMAEKAADRVVQTGRPYALRPMSAQDRRMIHLTLQDHTLVSTESVGEEGSRLVVVYSRSMNPEDLARFLEQAPSMAEGRPPRRGGDRSRGHGRGPRGPSREGGRDRGPRPSGPRREPSL